MFPPPPVIQLAKGWCEMVCNAQNGTRDVWSEDESTIILMLFRKGVSFGRIAQLTEWQLSV